MEIPLIHFSVKPSVKEAGGVPLLSLHPFTSLPCSELYNDGVDERNESLEPSPEAAIVLLPLFPLLTLGLSGSDCNCCSTQNIRAAEEQHLPQDRLAFPQGGAFHSLRIVLSYIDCK